MERQKDCERLPAALSRLSWSGVALDTTSHTPTLLAWPIGDPQNALERCEQRLASLSSAAAGLYREGLREGLQPQLKWEVVDSNSSSFLVPALASLSGHFSAQRKSRQSPLSLVSNDSIGDGPRRRKQHNLGSIDTEWELDSFGDADLRYREDEPLVQNTLVVYDGEEERSHLDETLSTVHTERGRIRPRLKRLAALVKDIDAKSLGLFLAKVLALAVVHQATTCGGKSHILVWRGLQCACLVHASPWKVGRVPGIAPILKPFKQFTRPMVILSIATLFSGSEGPSTALPQLEPAEVVRAGHNAQTHAEGDLELRALEALKAELQLKNVDLPPRVDDSELRYFLRSSAYYLPVVIKKLQDHLLWRRTQIFLTQAELEKWEHLAFWHGSDGEGRPCLVVRLGQAYQELAPSEQATFVSVLISHTEHGATQLVRAGTAVEDLTIIVDCFGMQLLSLPVSLMKAAAETLQRNYPRRLANMYLLNVPGFLRIVAMAILSVCGPITRQKIRVLGDYFTPVVEQQLGSLERLPRVLGGQCQCAKCDQVEAQLLTIAPATPRPLLRVQGAVATPETVGMENWEEVPQATAAASPAEPWGQIIAILGLFLVMLIPVIIKFFTAEWRSAQELGSEVVT